MNHLPVVHDDSHGFWRRAYVIPLQRQFVEPHLDKHLPEILRQEGPGILAWLVQGALEWQPEGLQPPDSVREASARYQRASDPLHAFLEACALIDPGGRVRAGDVYRCYQAWADAEGLSRAERLSHRRFGERMADRFHRENTAQGRYYEGLELAGTVFVLP